MSDPAPTVDPPEALGRRERRKLEVRGRILEAAAELFDARGVGATTVAEIAERADVAQKTVFNHFESKPHLIRELAREAQQQLLADIEAARKRPAGTRERLQHFFDQIAERAEKAGPMHRELLSELIHASYDEGIGSEQTRQLQDAFGAIIRDGRALGDVTDTVDEQVLTELVMGAFYVLMFNQANLEAYPIRQRSCALADFLAKAIERAGANAAPGRSEEA